MLDSLFTATAVSRLMKDRFRMCTAVSGMDQEKVI